jgi:hypothetical protein
VIVPLIATSVEDREAFETPPVEEMWPEIGSRALVQAVGGGPEPYFDQGGQIVQEGRYR